MKKALLYIIIFVTLFVGTATCVVVNGYSNYQKSKNENVITEVAEDNTALTTLASNVLNSESYSGTIEITDSASLCNITGSFSYINAGDISAQIELGGIVNNYEFNADIILLNSQLYLDFNGIKLTLKTNDILTAVNAVMASLNTSSGSSFSEFDMSSIQSLLADITTTELGSGYCINANLPNLCNVFIVTNSEYIPNQILITNLKLNNSVFTININASQKRKEIIAPNSSVYTNASPALNYIAPILSTLSQENLSIGGKLIIGGEELTIKAYLTNPNMIYGEIGYNNLKLEYQFDGKFITVNLYGNIYKLTIDEIASLISQFTGDTSSSSVSTIEEDVLSLFNIEPTIKDGLITNCLVTVGDIVLDLNIGKSYYIPQTFNAINAQNATDLNNLISSFKNIISNKYSIDISVKYDNISISGRAYADLCENFSGINSLAFEGDVNGFDVILAYTSSTTYLSVNNNNIKLQNSSLEKVISTLFDYIVADDTKLQSSLDLDVSLLNKITLSGRTIKFEDENISLQLVSFITTYKLTANIYGVEVSAKIMPNSSTYKYIENNIEPQMFTSYDNAPDLLNAIINTLEQDKLTYIGDIDIRILDFTYKNIGVKIQADTLTKKIEITLTNLPTDSVLTYLSNTYYTNHTSKITIQNGNISIYSTFQHRLTKKTLCYANKTLPLSEFSLDNLYDICAVKTSIIDMLKSSNNGNNFSTNLSADCIEIFEHNTLVDLIDMVPEIFTHLLVEFYYDDDITKATLHCNVNSILFVNIVLEKR